MNPNIGGSAMRQSVMLTREDLYEQIWTDPVIHVAAKYGLTGNGLKKICRHANIPVPPPGYWQRLRVGRPDPRPPLPPATPGNPATLTITPTPGAQGAKEAAARIQADPVPETVIIVPDRLASPHPLIQLTRIALEHGHVDDYSAVHGRRDQQWLDVRLSKTILLRGLRLLDALFKALATRGATVHLSPEPRRGTYVKVGDDEVRIRLEEEFTRKDHVPSKTDKPYLTPKWDYVATGNLVFRIDEYVAGTRKTWRGGRTQRLENLLPAALQGILVTAEMLRTRRLESERQERERQAALARQAELERLRREEEARRQELEHQVNRWIKSQNLRAYLRAVEQEALRRGLLTTPDTRAGRWLSWACEHADRLDPIAGVFEHNKEA
jgi:hypothetical protein